MNRVIRAFVVLAVVVVVNLMVNPIIFHKLGMHPEYAGEPVKLPGKKALVITTSHDVLAEPGKTEGWPTGVFASEMTHPYYTFLDGGMQVDIASIKGGEIPIDPLSFNFAVISPEDKRFRDDPVAKEKVRNSIRIADVNFADYDLIMISGGWGAAYDLAQSPLLAKKITEAYYSDNKPLIGGVCHGVLGLVSARDRNGEHLLAGRKVTGVTDKQIKELRIGVTPLHPETELRKIGAQFESRTAFRDFFATHVVVDEEKRFVTGQNQNSGLEASHLMMRLLAQRG